MGSALLFRPLPVLFVSALTAGLLGGASALAAPAGATAEDPVWFKGRHFEVRASDTTVQPGDPVTLTVITTNTDNVWRALNLRLHARQGGNPFTEASCEVVTGGQPEACGTAHNGRPLNLVYGGSTRVAPHSRATVRIRTTVRPDAGFRTYTFSPWGRSSNAHDTGDVFTPAAPALTVPSPEADVAVGLEASAPPLLNGAVTYTQTTANKGPGTLRSATVTTQLPARVTRVTGLPETCSYDAARRRVECATGPLAVGEQSAVRFKARLGLLTVGSRLDATATRVASAPADPHPDNDRSTATCSAQTALHITCP